MPIKHRIKAKIGDIISRTRDNGLTYYRVKTAEGWLGCRPDGTVRTKSEGNAERHDKFKQNNLLPVKKPTPKPMQSVTILKERKSRAFIVDNNPKEVNIKGDGDKIKVRLSRSMEVYILPENNNPAHIKELKVRYKIPV